MAYCRFNDDSDVYLVLDNSNEFCCIGCGFSEPKIIDGEMVMGESRYFKSKQDTLQHLEDHRKAGDKVPQFAIDRLKIEIEEDIDNLFVKRATEYFNSKPDDENI